VTETLLRLADRVHRWRIITPGRRAELVLLLADLHEQIASERIDEAIDVCTDGRFANRFEALEQLARWEERSE